MAISLSSQTARRRVVTWIWRHEMALAASRDYFDENYVFMYINKVRNDLQQLQELKFTYELVLITDAHYQDGEIQFLEIGCKAKK